MLDEPGRDTVRVIALGIAQFDGVHVDEADRAGAGHRGELAAGEIGGAAGHRQQRTPAPRLAAQA